MGRSIQVVFLRNHGTYAAGEVANLPEPKAERLIKGGIVRRHEPPSPREKKDRPQ